jgi:hypothetical protein
MLNFVLIHGSWHTGAHWTPVVGHLHQAGHQALPRGRRILEKKFPGITSELKAAGAEILDMANDVAWLTPQGWVCDLLRSLKP